MPAHRSIDKVVILAAGMGTRLKSDDGPPKPLVDFGKKALIVRVLERFADAGVNHAIIITGYRGQEITTFVQNAGVSMSITFVDNPEYHKANGISVIRAKAAVGDDNFFLSMADHIFDASLIQRLAHAPLPQDGLVLAIDKKLDTLYDEDDATKVRVEGSRILEIHKELQQFNAVDTGLFACTPALITELERLYCRHGDCTLSQGVKALCDNGKALAHDIGDGRWQDVDTPGALEHAITLFLSE